MCRRLFDVGHCVCFANQKLYKEAQDNRAWELQEQAIRSSGESLNKVTLENYQSQISNLQKELSDLRTQTEKNAGQMAAINNQLLAEQQKTASLTGQVTQLTSMINAGDAERKELQTQLQNVRNDNTALRTDNLKLAETNQNELQAQLYRTADSPPEGTEFLLGDRVKNSAPKFRTPRRQTPVSDSGHRSRLGLGTSDSRLSVKSPIFAITSPASPSARLRASRRYGIYRLSRCAISG